MTEAPLFEATDARIALDDVVAIERLTLVTGGRRLLVLGDATALFAAISGVPLATKRGPSPGARDPDAPAGEARVTAGSMRIAGRDVAKGEHFGVTGVAPLDPPMPPWSVEDYLTWSGRLAGASRRLALQQARAALERLGLAAWRGRYLPGLAKPERRAVVVAAAIVGSPEVVIAEGPLSGLDGPAAAFVLGVVAGATEGRGAILSAGRLDPTTPEGSLARGSTDLAILVGGEVALAGAPSDVLTGARLFGLTVRTNVDALRAALEERGVELRGGPLRFSIALAEGQSTKDVLAAAAAAKAAVVELVPLV